MPTSKALSLRLLIAMFCAASAFVSARPAAAHPMPQSPDGRQWATTVRDVEMGPDELPQFSIVPGDGPGRRR